MPRRRQRLAVCNEARDRATHDRARDRCPGAILLRSGRQRLWYRRDRDGLRKAGKGYVLGVASNTCSTRGARERLSPARPQEIAQGLAKRAWRRFRPVQEPKATALHDWAYLELADLEVGEYNERACRRLDAGPSDPPQHRRRRSRLLLDMVPRGHIHEELAQWKDIAGPSRTASKPPRTNSASITTKPVPGMVGTAMSRSSCWPSP